MSSGGVTLPPASTAATPYLTVDPGKPGMLRLFCFHHAGGAASVFSGWRGHLGPDVTVLPVQLPGRERRLREPRLVEMSKLVQELDRQLDPYLDCPHAFYGHSMGGLVAWNLARQRTGAGRRLPIAFLVGACNPPHLPPLPAGIRGMSRDRLLSWLIDMGGISDTALGYRNWVDAALSLLRDDLALCESHPHAEHRLSPPDPLPIPLHAFAGTRDAAVDADAMAGWCRYGSPGEMHTVPGGHLFFRDSPGPLLELLRSVLARIRSGPTSGAGIPQP